MMKLIKPYELELGSVPFSERDDEVVYVASAVNPVLDEMVLRHLPELEREFAYHFLRFRYERLDPGEGKDVEPSVVCRAHRLSDTSYRAYHLDLSFVDCESLIIQQFKDVAKAYSRREAVSYERETKDKETQDMLVEMERLARALLVKGVKTDLFESMIRSLEHPVRMTVLPSGLIEFKDLGSMQLHLKPVEKTLYFFFLRHPEGIHPDALIGYRKELLDLYSKASRFDEWQVAEDVIDSLCAEDKNVLYSNISRIKSGFRKFLGDRLYPQYVIRKTEDKLYRIDLPRELVTWVGDTWRG